MKIIMKKIERSNNTNNEFQERGVEVLPLNKLFEKERKAKKMPFKLLSKETGISVRNLQKIEEGKWSDLPARIYIIDFLSRCEKALGLSSGHFVDVYNSEFKYQDDINLKVKKISKKSFVVTPKIIAKSTFFLFIISILFYFVFQLSYLLGNPKLIVTSPKDDIITSTKDLVISGITQPDNKVYINDNELFVDSNGEFTEIIPLQPGLNTIKVKAKNRLNKEFLIIRRVILEE